MVGNRFDVFAMFIIVSICLSCASVLSGAGTFFTFFSVLFARLPEPLDDGVTAAAGAGPLVVEALDVEDGSSRNGGAALVDRFDATFKAENERMECGKSRLFLKWEQRGTHPTVIFAMELVVQYRELKAEDFDNFSKWIINTW
jgi:hypothetical protein